MGDLDAITVDCVNIELAAKRAAARDFPNGDEVATAIRWAFSRFAQSALQKLHKPFGWKVMATLYRMVGLPCSGKTTRPRE